MPFCWADDCTCCACASAAVGASVSSSMAISPTAAPPSALTSSRSHLENTWVQRPGSLPSDCSHHCSRRPTPQTLPPCNGPAPHAEGKDIGTPATIHRCSMPDTARHCGIGKHTTLWGMLTVPVGVRVSSSTPCPIQNRARLRRASCARCIAAASSAACHVGRSFTPYTSSAPKHDATAHVKGVCILGVQTNGSQARYGPHAVDTVCYGDSCDRQSPSVQVAIYRIKGQEVFILCLTSAS